MALNNVGPQVDIVDPSNCEGEVPPPPPPPPTVEDPEPPGDGGWGPEPGDDPTNPGGTLNCYLYPNPFCDCDNGVFFNCDFGGDDGGITSPIDDDLYSYPPQQRVLIFASLPLTSNPKGLVRMRMLRKLGVLWEHTIQQHKHIVPLLVLTFMHQKMLFITFKLLGEEF